MANLLHLRLAAREVFDEALRAVDARAAVRAAIRLEESSVNVCGASFNLSPDQPVYSIAIGKAAASMALGFGDQIGERFSSGFIAGPIAGQPPGQELYGFPARLSTRWRWCGGEHPLPNKASLTAGEFALALLDQANQETGLIVFLISGGGSAMMEWPINDRITLANLRMANKALISSGASIGEVNAVRRVFSAVKGGKLAARAPNCQQVTLIVSDVPKGREHDVASGPTLTPPADEAAAVEVIDRYGLRDQMPQSIMQAIDDSALAEPAQPTEQPYFVLLDNYSALDGAASAARKRGFTPAIAPDISDEQIKVGVKNLLAHLVELKNPDTDACLISGGEFACPVRGEGIGGRNLETALRLAIAAEEHRDRIGEFVALCAGTDGIDGNSPAAGAIVDSTTIERARQIGLDPIDFLERSDSYSFFVALGDALSTGPTGTNVRDLRILLAACQNRER